MKTYFKEKKEKKPIINEPQQEDWESGEVKWDFDENTLEKEEKKFFNPFVYSYILFQTNKLNILIEIKIYEKQIIIRNIKYG